MPSNALVIQQPDGQSAQLILLFHGFGNNANSMRAVGVRLAAEFPRAMVISVQAAAPSQSPEGFQWFDGGNLTEENRPQRVAAAMSAFLQTVTYWQHQAGVGADATALIGFSQGAIMALESTQQVPTVASRVVAMGGRFASLPESNVYGGTIHFLHGKDDSVIPYKHTVVAAHHLRDLGLDLTAEVRPHIGHEVHPEFMELMVQKLSTHISHRIWTAAMQAQTEPKQ
jgi:phospholipase/carboxylesterase